MTKRIALALSLLIIVAASCIKREVTFNGKTIVNTDGSIFRSAGLVIAPAEDEGGTQDSSEAFKYYAEHYEPLDTNRYEIQKHFADGILTVSWSGLFTADEMPLTDYKHRTGEGPAATNKISVDVKNRWVFKNGLY